MTMKQCPFCANNEQPPKRVSEKVEHSNGSYHLEIRFMCQNCGAFGPNAETITDAERLWDMRRETFPT